MKLKPLLETPRGFNAAALELQSMLEEYDGLELDVKLEHEVDDTRAEPRDEIIFRVEDLGLGEWVSCRLMLKAEKNGDEEKMVFYVLDEDGRPHLILGRTPDVAMMILFPWLISYKLVNELTNQGVGSHQIVVNHDKVLEVIVDDKEGRADSTIKLTWDFSARAFETSVGEFAAYDDGTDDTDFFQINHKHSGKLLKTVDEAVEIVLDKLNR